MNEMTFSPFPASLIMGVNTGRASSSGVETRSQPRDKQKAQVMRARLGERGECVSSEPVVRTEGL